MRGWSVSAWVSVASNALVLTALGLAWADALPAAPLGYANHKLLHLLGMVVFLGNLVAGPLWIMLAWWGPDRGHLAFAARTLSAADIWLTTPGVQLAVWNGALLAPAMGGMQAPWLRESALLVALTCAVSVGLVLPWQERFVAAATAGDEAGLRRAFIGWSLTGSVVMLPIGLVFWEMVSKQALVLGP